jgi:hypothetical protein
VEVGRTLPWAREQSLGSQLIEIPAVAPTNGTVGAAEITNFSASDCCGAGQILVLEAGLEVQTAFLSWSRG